MKDLKRFDAKDELDAVIEALEAAGIQSEYHVDNGYILRVYVSDIIRARDVLLDMEDS